MSCKELHRLRVELDFRCVADINLGEIVLVETTTHHLAILQDALTLQFFLGAKYIPSGIQLLILCIDDSSLLLAFCLQIIDIGIPVVDRLVKSCTMDVSATACLFPLIASEDSLWSS